VHYRGHQDKALYNVTNQVARIYFKTLQNCAREHSAENAARASQTSPKDKTQATLEQSEEFHASTSQNPHFLRGILYFSLFHLNDLVKIFILTILRQI